MCQAESVGKLVRSQNKTPVQGKASVTETATSSVAVNVHCQAGRSSLHAPALQKKQRVVAAMEDAYLRTTRKAVPAPTKCVIDAPPKFVVLCKSVAGDRIMDILIENPRRQDFVTIKWKAQEPHRQDISTMLRECFLWFQGVLRQPRVESSDLSAPWIQLVLHVLKDVRYSGETRAWHPHDSYSERVEPTGAMDAACSALLVLTEQECTVRTLVQLDGVNILLNALKRGHTNHEQVLVDACSVLGRIVKMQEENVQANVASSHLVRILLARMIKHVGDESFQQFIKSAGDVLAQVFKNSHHRSQLEQLILQSPRDHGAFQLLQAELAIPLHPPTTIPEPASAAANLAVSLYRGTPAGVIPAFSLGVIARNKESA